ncbi:MAG: class I SAM-dependent DNA methyltransferase, partial [Candidatus Omnitrophica bacterium]|nr:class I SAM-dependent DNA methyltransferase [Candidatus Omnitrophota bacterium]
MDVKDFVERWKASGGAERANYALFLSELCDVIGVSPPDPTKEVEEENAYVFEKSVTFHHGDGSQSTGRIDLYKRGCFVLETKQGVEKDEEDKPLSTAFKARQAKRKKGTATRGTAAWDESMIRARGQAEQYARALPPSEGRPPFLIVVDVGHSIELYSEFTQSGGTYVPFPDPRSHRFNIRELLDPSFREGLRTIWTDPLSLDPSRHSAKVTREIAGRLAKLAKSLEASGHEPEAVAHFLMRCIFTMFAEDVEFLPKNSFTELLESLRGNVSSFVPMIEELWGTMKAGGFSTALREKILRFNGALFEENQVLGLTQDQFELLIEASRADWKDVEPAIFGTLLERALDPVERHKLGAHYTPRAYVERLVLPTVVEPIREDWAAAQTTAFTLATQGKENEAIQTIQGFHRQLCEVKILDPACGSGNFLYVTLEHLKRIEGEVLSTLFDLTEKTQTTFDTLGISMGLTVDPHQLLGLEINPRAAAIAELVLWIGYLQWHRRTHGDLKPQEPIIKNFHNIECRDA